jgi:hypothetical protein
MVIKSPLLVEIAIVTPSKKLKKDKSAVFATQSRDDAPHYQHSEIGTITG